MDETPTVLFVDDEPAIAEGHATRLQDRYETMTANDGETALELLDDDVDVAFLDRRMPGMSGEEVLEAIRDEGYDCRVVMLTGVEPDEDVVEMGFDEYLVKPIGKRELREMADRMARRPPDEIEDDVLDALGDAKTRHCCWALVDEMLSASELADRTGYSLPTVYRRLNTLQQAGIIESQNEYDPDGDHYKTFRAISTRVQVRIGDGFRVDVDRSDQQTA